MLTLFVFVLAVERADCRISRMGENHCACRKTCERSFRLNKVFPGSKTASVNHLVAGSNPAAGAIFCLKIPLKGAIYYFQGPVRWLFWFSRLCCSLIESIRLRSRGCPFLSEYGGSHGPPF